MTAAAPAEKPKVALAALRKIPSAARTPEQQTLLLALERRVLDMRQLALAAKAASLRDADRRARTARLIGVGGLVEKAGLAGLDSATLLGGLIALADHLRSSPSAIAEWKRVGGMAMNASKKATDARRPVVVAFPSQPPAEVRKALRGLKLRWSDVRAEWDGHADPAAVRALVTPLGGTVTVVEAAAT